MQYISHYHSPIGNIFLVADEIGLVGLWLEGQKYFARQLSSAYQEEGTPLLLRAKEWLDIYFSGEESNFTIPLHLTSTDFQNEV